MSQVVDEKADQHEADVFSWVNDSLDKIRQEKLLRQLRSRVTSPARDFASNDYLGLRNDPRLHQAGHKAASKHGVGGGSSPAVSGWTDQHSELCELIAKWKGTEASLVFSSGYIANFSTVVAMVQSGDVVYVDRLAHACLIDGARISGAKLRVFPHNDVPKLAEIMRRDSGLFRRRLIITESLFSMDGDQAPLVALSELASQNQAMLLIDEAHASGLYGPQGQGLIAAFGLSQHPNLIRLGTLSKAVGGQGGFVAGSQKLIDWLVQSARGWIYSTSLSPYLAGAAAESIRNIEKEPWRREKVLASAQEMRLLLRSSGWDVHDGDGPIVPVLIGDPAKTLNISHELEKSGFLVGAIRPPTVPVGTARLRISMTSHHGTSETRQLVDALNSVGR